VLDALAKPAQTPAAAPAGHFTSGIRCPYHAWTYTLEGQLRTAPFLEDDDKFRREDFPLFPVGLKLDWERGIPRREGAWTFTHSGTTARAPFPGLNDDERIRHKGELIYQLPALALGRPCRGTHPLARRTGAHHHHL
jgi:hypothetical protein